jgi:PAS domain S-box-containing protein
MSQKNLYIDREKPVSKRNEPIVQRNTPKTGRASRQLPGETHSPHTADTQNGKQGPCRKPSCQALLAGTAEMEITTGRFLSMSKSVSELTGFSEKDLFSMSALEVVGRLSPKMVPTFERRFNALAAGEDVPPRMQYLVESKNGNSRWIEVHSTQVWDDSGVPEKVNSVFMDITGQKETEEKLLAARQELETKSAELTEVNEALKKLLAQNREDARRFEQRVAANVEDLVLPYLVRLQETELSTDQKVLVNVALANLKELTAPFMRELSLRFPDLTPREVEVANLVRMGSASKEIARLLSITRRAVEFHRDSLREKLGIKKSRRNLRAFLASL